MLDMIGVSHWVREVGFHSSYPEYYVRCYSDISHYQQELVTKKSSWTALIPLAFPANRLAGIAQSPPIVIGNLSGNHHKTEGLR